MDISEAIQSRRSIRKYKPIAPSDQIIEHLIEAAMSAPSSGNLQSRYIYVVRDDELRKKMAALALDQSFIHEAPIALVVCVDLRIEREYGERGQNLFAVLDCAAAIENLMLMAVGKGLGSCWVGAFDQSKIAELLAIPEHLRPISIVAVGYPDESPGQPERPPLTSLYEVL